ncbi:hypothetical protein ABT061_01975 [Streptosporangium sp. NPDC002544]
MNEQSDASAASGGGAPVSGRDGDPRRFGYAAGRVATGERVVRR